MGIHFQQLMLPAGRRIDVRVSGPEGGFPLVFHHGTPGAATPMRALERAAHKRGLRLVAASRPGYGRSSRHEGRRVVDVVSDTKARPPNARWLRDGRQGRRLALQKYRSALRPGGRRPPFWRGVRCRQRLGLASNMVEASGRTL